MWNKDRFLQNIDDEIQAVVEHGKAKSSLIDSLFEFAAGQQDKAWVAFFVLLARGRLYLQIFKIYIYIPSSSYSQNLQPKFVNC